MNILGDSDAPDDFIQVPVEYLGFIMQETIRKKGVQPYPRGCDSEPERYPMKEDPMVIYPGSFVLPLIWVRSTYNMTCGCCPRLCPLRGGGDERACGLV